MRRTIRIAALVRILLTNDDGIHAPGFAVLESIAAKLSDDVWASRRPRSSRAPAIR